MALYMGQAVPEEFTIALEAAARAGGKTFDATSQNLLNALAAAGVRTLDDARLYGLGLWAGSGVVPDAQLIASSPDPSQYLADVSTAEALGFSSGFSSRQPSLPSFPLPGFGLNTPGTVPGGFPSGTTGLPSTGVDWLDGLINFGVDTFLAPGGQAPRLPMPGGNLPAPIPPRLPGGGAITVNIGGRPRTISAATALKVAAAAAALGLTVEQYLQTYGVPGQARRMNPLNPKALSRALRRSTAFAKFAKRTITLVDRGPIAGVRFKKRGKKRC